MELGNFGAILSHALKLEGQAIAFYEATARGRHEEVFRNLVAGSRQRARLLERARREGIVELALEPIPGLRDDPYQVELNEGAAAAELVQQAIGFETASARFYLDSAAKLPLLGTARLFQRLAHESRKRKALLEALAVDR